MKRSKAIKVIMIFGQKGRFETSPSNCLAFAMVMSQPVKMIASAAVLIAPMLRFFRYPLMFFWFLFGKMVSMMMKSTNIAKRIFVFMSKARIMAVHIVLAIKTFCKDLLMLYSRERV